MQTMKEYGLIFGDGTVKIAEVTVQRDPFASFCVAGLLQDLEDELKGFLQKEGYHPIAVLPDTALKGGYYTGSIVRCATEEEAKQYLFDYENGVESILPKKEERNENESCDR